MEIYIFPQARARARVFGLYGTNGISREGMNLLKKYFHGIVWYKGTYHNVPILFISDERNFKSNLVYLNVIIYFFSTDRWHLFRCIQRRTIWYYLLLYNIMNYIINLWGFLRNIILCYWLPADKQNLVNKRPNFLQN